MCYGMGGYMLEIIVYKEVYLSADYLNIYLLHIIDI